MVGPFKWIVYDNVFSGFQPEVDNSAHGIPGDHRDNELIATWLRMMQMEIDANKAFI